MRIYAVHWHDEHPLLADWYGSLEELLESNMDGYTDQEIAEVVRMQPGQSMEFGGGAAARCTLTREQ